jgi:hypothetical protein
VRAALPLACLLLRLLRCWSSSGGGACLLVSVCVCLTACDVVGCRMAVGVCWSMQTVRAALPLACLLLRLLRCWLSSGGVACLLVSVCVCLTACDVVGCRMALGVCWTTQLAIVDVNLPLR